MGCFLVGSSRTGHSTCSTMATAARSFCAPRRSGRLTARDQCCGLASSCAPASRPSTSIAPTRLRHEAPMLLRSVDLLRAQVHEGDIVLAATDGVFDNLFDWQVQTVVARHLQRVIEDS